MTKAAPPSRRRAGPQSAGEEGECAGDGTGDAGEDADCGHGPAGPFEGADPELVVLDVGADVLGLVEKAVHLGLDPADRLRPSPWTALA